MARAAEELGRIACRGLARPSERGKREHTPEDAEDRPEMAEVPVTPDRKTYAGLIALVDLDPLS
jgi:hypothetical protein